MNTTLTNFGEHIWIGQIGNGFIVLSLVAAMLAAVGYYFSSKDELNSELLDMKNIFEKSLAVNKDLKVGHKLTFEDLETKKPKGYGIDAKDFQEVIGKVLVKDLKEWDFLTEEDIQ